MTALLVGCLLAWFHPDSLSSSRLRVDGDGVWLHMRCQVLSLLEVIPELDADADGVVDADEVAAQREAIVHYVGEHYRLHVGSDRQLAGGRRLSPQAVGVAHVPEDAEDAIGYRMGAVDVELAYRHDGPVADLLIESRLFALTSPAHIDLATVVWPDGGTRTFSLTAEAPRGRSDPSGRGAGWAFVRLGWEHILSGWDHLAFVAALLLASAGLRGLLGVVTAFTLAHSLTLGLSVLDVLSVGRFGPFVEALIALSVAYVAADTALAPDRLRSRWKEAFAFGLVHGLGFAGFLRESLLQEEARVAALVGFNAGVELGQIAVVLVLVLILRPFVSDAAPGPSPLAPRGLRRFGSLAIAVLGLFWFAERLFG